MRSSWFIVLAVAVGTLLVVLPRPHDRRGVASPAAGAAAKEAQATLLFTVWGMPFEDRLFEDVYARGYEAANPGLRIDYRRFGADLLMKYNAWHARGEGPDVMRLRITDYHGMVARGMLEPLDDWINDEAVGLSPFTRQSLPPHLMGILPIDGKTYALPEDNAQYGLFYNRAIFDAHNRDHPADPVPYPAADWTWEDLRDAAKKLTRRTPAGQIDVAGIDFAIWAWPFITLHAQAGGELWSPDGRACLIEGPAGVRTLEFLRALQRDDGSFRVTLGRDSPMGPDALFAAGKTAMYLDGSWRVPALEGAAPDLDFAVAPLPRGPREGGRPAVVSGCVLWGISSHSRHKAEAWRMLKWLVAAEQAAAYWDTLRVAPPANLAVLNSPAFRSTRGIRRADGAWEVPPMPPERFADRAEWILYANAPHPLSGLPPGFIPVGTHQTELEAAIHEMLESWLNPSSTESAPAALRRAARRVEAVMGRDQP